MSIFVGVCVHPEGMVDAGVVHKELAACAMVHCKRVCLVVMVSKWVIPLESCI